MSSNSSFFDTIDTTILLAVTVPVGVLVCLVLLTVSILCSWWCCLFVRRRRRIRQTNYKKQKRRKLNLSSDDVSSSRQAAGSDRSSQSEEMVMERANTVFRQANEPYFNTKHCKPRPPPVPASEEPCESTTIRSNGSDPYYALVSPPTNRNSSSITSNSCAAESNFKHPVLKEQMSEEYYTTMNLDRDTVETTTDPSGEEYYTTMSMNDIAESSVEHQMEEGRQPCPNQLQGARTPSTSQANSKVDVPNLDRRGTVESVKYENVSHWAPSTPLTPTSPIYANVYDSVTTNATSPQQSNTTTTSPLNNGQKVTLPQYTNMELPEPSGPAALPTVAEAPEYIDYI